MRKLAAFILLTLTAPFLIQGLSFEPLSQNFSPSSSGRIRTFRVTNTQAEQIAVRIEVATRGLTTDGEEIRSDASDDFLIFPSRVTIGPGASQAVRVQWLGPEEIESEIAYRIIAEQVPVVFQEDEETGTSINLMFRYVGSIYVVPPGAEPDVSITEAVREFDGAELTGLRLRLENIGTSHAVVQRPNVRIVYREEQSDLEESIELSEADIPAFSGVNLLAGSSIVEVVDIPSHWKLGTVDADITFHLVQ